MMRPRAVLKTMLLLILLSSLTMAALPVYAQDATAESSAETASEDASAPGLASGVLLIGVLAVIAVGGVALMRERSGKTIS